MQDHDNYMNSRVCPEEQAEVLEELGDSLYEEEIVYL